jgi:hypothetical protein
MRPVSMFLGFKRCDMPHLEFAVFRMSAVSHHLKEVLKTGRSTDILRRASSFSLDEVRIDCVGIGRGRRLDLQCMAPVISLPYRRCSGIAPCPPPPSNW